MKRHIFNETFFAVYFLWILLPTGLILAGDGDLDPSFDGNGKQTVDFGGIDIGRAIAIQSDGKIVGVGQSSGVGGPEWALTRLNADGSLDASFGTGGKVTLSLGVNDSLSDVAIQADGKIVVTGRASLSLEFFVARFNTNGTLDITWGGTGVVTTLPGFLAGESRALAIQADGSVVVVGNTFGGVSGDDFAVVRYLTNGTLDATFGVGGSAITNVSGLTLADHAYDVIIQPDGKIVVVGFSTSGLLTTNFAAVRYNTNGTLDGTFGAGGIVITNVAPLANDAATTVGLQSDGKIIVGGQSELILPEFALVRYTTAGVLDATFGTAGITITNVGPISDTAGRLAIQADDKIVFVGTSVSFGLQGFTVLRYTSNGNLDTSFGGTGIVTPDFSLVDLGADVAIQADNKIVVIGASGIDEGAGDFAFARFGFDDSCGLDLVGSDTLVERFGTFQKVAAGGRIAQLAKIDGGFGLCGDGTWSSNFACHEAICLNGFTLTLVHDLYTHNKSRMSTMGNIIGNGYQLDLAKSVTCIPTLDCPEAMTTVGGNDSTWTDLAVFLNCNVCLKDTYITFTGQSMINGRGQVLTLDPNSGILVDDGGTLLLKNIVIKGVNQSNIACLDARSTISLKDVTWILDGDYTFSIGRFDAIADFKVVGDGYNFIYQSPEVSAIHEDATMILDRGLTFVYDAADNDLLNLVTKTSQLILNGATVDATTTLQLLRGKLIVDKKSFLASSAVSEAGGIMFGDGISAANNLQVIIEPAATLELTSGFLVQADV